MGKYIGSHNSMSYLTVENKRLKFINKYFAQCQNKTIDEQLENGIKCFDLRVYNNITKYKQEDGSFICQCRWNFAHGLINYDNKVILYDILHKFNKYAHENRDTIFVRLILEKSNSKYDKNQFKILCNYVETNYKYITFIGGYNKKDWELLYDFELYDNNTNFIFDVTQFVGSMAYDAYWYERFIPRLYAKRCNKINRLNLQTGINLFDFV